MAMDKISTIEKKNVPRNFLTMYQSRRFIRYLDISIYRYLGISYYIRCMRFGITLAFQLLKSPARICCRACVTRSR